MMIYNGKKWLIISAILFIYAFSGFSQSLRITEENWISSRMKSMTLDEKIGQLFIVRAYARKNPSEDRLITEYIQKYHIGGLCFFQGSPETMASLISRYQSLSDLPMFMSLDAEWGLGMRYPGRTISFPRNMMLGAIQDNTRIYELGYEIGRQCREAGININFAPVVDIHSNPNNPVIYDRSFGDSPFHVTAKAFMYLRGMEDAGVLSCIKHFPGHGDTFKDSHFDLPTITHNIGKLNIYEFFPFKQLIQENLNALMVGHLHIAAIDSTSVIPASLSHNMVWKILRNELGYEGLIFTDAMDMHAVTKRYARGEAEALAFMAGNDIILLPENLPLAFNTIKTYIEVGKISMERLDESVERILRVKFNLGLPSTQYKARPDLMSVINSRSGQALKQSLSEAAVTVVADKDNMIPYKNPAPGTVATLSYNVAKKTVFQERIESYTDADDFQLMPHQLRRDYSELLQKLSHYEEIIIAIHTSGRRSDYSSRLPRLFLKMLDELQKKSRVIIVLFGNPYLLTSLEDMEHILINYDNERTTQDATAQGLMGVFDLNGTLPFSISPLWQTGHGLTRNHLDRMGYALPESVGLSSEVLKGIDSVMAKAIKSKAFPGGQVVVAKDRRIIYQKSFGSLTYSEPGVNDNTIYDLASLTKILSTSLIAMHLYEKGEMLFHDPLNEHIFNIDTTNKADITVGSILAHHSRLHPWIPFYEAILSEDKNKSWNDSYFRKTLQTGFTHPVAKGMFVRDDFMDSVYTKIYHSPLRESDSYKYSDLGFYLLYKIFQNKLNLSIDEFVFRQFYFPMGLRYTGFNPVYKFDLNQIAPSEKDDYFRHQIIRGHVQDRGAALMGGVSGHSGLFSTATEVTILMQMLLNEGQYGGIRFFNPGTVHLFTSRYPSSSRRGYGFDMKEKDKMKKLNMSPLASEDTYGHLGYTGTATWADREHQLIFTFCSNSTYPSAGNRTLSNQKIREKIHTLIYKAMFEFKPE